MTEDPALTKLRQAAEAGTLTVWVLHGWIAEIEHCQHLPTSRTQQQKVALSQGQRCPRKAFRSNWHSSGERFAAHGRIVYLQYTWNVDIVRRIDVQPFGSVESDLITGYVRLTRGQELVWALDKGYENKRRAAAKMKATGL